MNLRAGLFLLGLGLVSLQGCDQGFGDHPALGGKWYLWSIDSTEIHSRSIPLIFDGASHVTGSERCNDFSGTYFATPKIIRFKGFELTTMGCIDSLYPEIDSRILMGLFAARTWSVRGSFLSLKDDNGSLKLLYGRNEPSPGF